VFQIFRRFRRACATADTGAAAVEMALVTPLLLLMLFGLIDFGRMFNAQITLTEAAREGARAVSLGLSPDPRINATLGSAPSSTTITSCAGTTGDASVALSQAFHPVTPIGSVIGAVTIRATGIMPCSG